MADDLAVSSLREALEAAVEQQPPHAAVRAVHLGQAAALLAFLRYQESRGRWTPRNPRRLAKVVRLDSLLRAIDTGLLPILSHDASSPRASDLLKRYAHHFKASAGAVGGSFAHQITVLAQALISYAKLPGGTSSKEAEALGKRIRRLRSTQLTIIDKCDDPESTEIDSASSDDDEPLDFDIAVDAAAPLRELLRSIAEKPGDGGRVIVRGIELCDAAPLRAVLSLQASARGWAVRGLDNLASIDACCQAVESGLLDILAGDPSSPAALELCNDFADYIKCEAELCNHFALRHVITLCNDLARHANAANPLSPADMKKSEVNLRRYLGNIRSIYISIV